MENKALLQNNLIYKKRFLNHSIKTQKNNNFKDILEKKDILEAILLFLLQISKMVKNYQLM